MEEMRLSMVDYGFSFCLFQATLQFAVCICRHDHLFFWIAADFTRPFSSDRLQVFEFEMGVIYESFAHSPS